MAKILDSYLRFSQQRNPISSLSNDFPLQAPADGAAALLIAHEEAVRSHGLRPLARVVGWTCVGVNPKDAGIGVVHAVRKLLEEQKLRVDDVDLFEVRS